MVVRGPNNVPVWLDLMQQPVSESACHRNVTMTFMLKIRLVDLETRKTMHLYSVYSLCPKQFKLIMYTKTELKCSFLLQLEEGEIDVRFNSFKGCIIQNKN